VALKVIKLGMDTKAVVARFEAERQALAMMDHPNIAKVFDAGTTETGRPYFIMELVRGIRITEYCDQNNLSVPERLDLFIKVCQAIQHAHQKGIIHRDIKPSNILVTLHDGLPVPKVIDFGIAKATEGRLTDATVYTQLHQFVGTPAYMSPEQAEMSGLDIDTRSDIYSLGVLLYELLAGSTPFDPKELVASGIDAMRKTIREKEALRPSTRLATLKGEELTTTARRRSAEAPKLIYLLKGDLDWIVMKCLEKDRTRRYETANGLAADLKRHLNNEPVVARPPSTAYKMQKAWRRNRLAFSAAGMIALSVCVGAIISAWQAWNATRARNETERARVSATEARNTARAAEQQALRNSQRAEANEQRVQQRAYASDINLAQQALAAGNLGAAQDLLSQADLGDRRGWEWRYLWHQSRSQAISRFCSLNRTVYNLTASPDGHWLVVLDSADNARIMDCATRQVVAEFKTPWPPPIFSSLRGLLIYIGKLDSQTNEWGLHVWDPQTRRQVSEIPTGWCCGLGMSADEKTLITHQRLGKVTRWRFPEGRKISEASWERPLPRETGGAQWAVTRDARLAAIGGHSGEVVVLDLELGKELWRFKEANDPGVSLAFSPDGKLLAAGTSWNAGHIYLFDTATGRQVGRLNGHHSLVSTLVFWPDGSRLASASYDQRIGIWDLHDLANIPPPRMLRGHKLEIWSLALFPDGRTLASGSKDGEVLLWDTNRDEDEPFTTSLPSPSAKVIWCFSAERRSAVAVKLDSRDLFEWDGRKRSFERRPILSEPGARRACWSKDGDRLAVGGTNGTVQIWELAGQSLVEHFSVGTNEVVPLQFGSDGRLALVSSNQFDAWEISPPRKILTARIPEGGEIIDLDNYSTAFFELAPDLSQVLVFKTSLGKGVSFSLWNPASGKILELRNEDTAMQAILGVAFSPNGALVAESSLNGVTQIFDTSTGQTKAVLRCFFNGATSVAFSPEGNRLAIGDGGNGGIKIYDVATWRELITVPTGAFWVPKVSFSSDGNSLAAVLSDVSGKDLVRNWCVPSFEEIAREEAKNKLDVNR
jgi:WD40 repeat protein